MESTETHAILANTVRWSNNYNEDIELVNEKTWEQDPTTLSLWTLQGCPAGSLREGMRKQDISSSIIIKGFPGPLEWENNITRWSQPFYRHYVNLPMSFTSTVQNILLNSNGLKPATTKSCIFSWENLCCWSSVQIHKRDHGVPLEKAGLNNPSGGSKLTTCSKWSLEWSSLYQEKCLHGCSGLQIFSVSYNQVYFAVKDSLKQTAR